MATTINVKLKILSLFVLMALLPVVTASGQSYPVTTAIYPSVHAEVPTGEGWKTTPSGVLYYSSSNVSVSVHSSGN